MIRAACLAICAFFLLPACREAAEPERSARMDEIDRALVAEHFGTSVDGSLVVARAGSATITAADVAAWLELFPTLSVEQAVDDLVDAEAAHQAYAEHVDAVLERDARVRSRFYTWMSFEILPTIGMTAELEGSADAIANDTTALSEWGNPELVQASHILFRAHEAAEGEPTVNEAVRQAAQAALAELAAAEQPTAAALGRYADAYAASLELRGVNVRAERHMVFPRRYSGRPYWDGQAALVEEFAAAAFDAAVGELVGPVETSYGLHLIVVEAHLPARLEGAENRRATTADQLLVNHRVAQVQRILEELVARATVVIDPDAVLLIAQDQAMRMELEQRGMQDRFD